MPEKGSIPRNIADQAARWLAEQDSGLLGDETELAAWLAADPRHARAFAEMQAVWSDLGAVPASVDVRASLRPSPRRTMSDLERGSWRPSPRKWLPAAIAASIVIAVLGVAGDLPTRLRADAMTATGEQRTVVLADGSKVMLNSHSAIAYDYRHDRRVIRLLHGEAAFTVAPDRSRPFTVESGAGATTALGTRFVVRETGGSTRIAVTEHRVRVAYPIGGSLHVDVSEGQGVSYDSERGIGTVSAINAANAEAWTQGFLIFESRPLAEVVAELNRYYPGYIRLIGDDLQSRRVSGVFSIRDPSRAIEKLQASLGLRSTRLTSRIIFIHA